MTPFPGNGEIMKSKICLTEISEDTESNGIFAYYLPPILNPTISPEDNGQLEIALFYRTIFDAPEDPQEISINGWLAYLSMTQW